MICKALLPFSTVYIPASDTEFVTESGKKATNAKGVKFLRMEGGSAIFQIASGSYWFATSN